MLYHTLKRENEHILIASYPPKCTNCLMVASVFANDVYDDNNVISLGRGGFAV